MAINKSATPPLEQYSDTMILQRILDGETPLYELLIRRYNAILYKIGRSYGYNHEDTEDLMQETYISVWRNLAQFEHRSSFKTWIARIMLNHCYQKKKKSETRQRLLSANGQTEKDSLMFQSSSDTEKTTINKELRYVVEKALSLLSEEYRIVFTLRELNGMSVAETATILSLSESNIKIRAMRAKNMLREKIEKMYSAEDIFEFNLVYCDSMVNKIMNQIKEIPLK